MTTVRNPDEDPPFPVDLGVPCVLRMEIVVE